MMTDRNVDDSADSDAQLFMQGRGSPRPSIPWDPDYNTHLMSAELPPPVLYSPTFTSCDSVVPAVPQEAPATDITATTTTTTIADNLQEKNPVQGRFVLHLGTAKSPSPATNPLALSTPEPPVSLFANDDVPQLGLPTATTPPVARPAPPEMTEPEPTSSSSSTSANDNRLPPRKRLSTKPGWSQMAHDLVDDNRHIATTRLIAKWVSVHGETAGDPEREAAAKQWARNELERLEAEGPSARSLKPVRRYKPPELQPGKSMKGDYDDASPSSETDDDDDDSEDLCHVCNKAGEVAMCDLCPRVYHEHCLAEPLPEDDEAEWECPVCRRLNDDDDEYCHDSEAAAEEEAAEKHEMAAWEQDAEAEAQEAEARFTRMVLRVGDLVAQAPSAKDPALLRDLSSMDRVILRQIHDQEMLQTATQRMYFAEALRLVEEGDEAIDIDMTQSGDAEQLACLKRAVQAMPTNTRILVNHHRVLNAVVQHLERLFAGEGESEDNNDAGGDDDADDGDDDNGMELVSFQQMLVLAESLRSREGFFPEDRPKVVQLVNTAVRSSVAAIHLMGPAKDLLAACPKLKHDIVNGGGGSSSAMSAKKSKAKSKAGGAMSNPVKPVANNNNNNGSSATGGGKRKRRPVLADNALGPLPKPPSLIPASMMNRRLCGQAQPDGSCDTGMPAGGDCFLLSKAHTLPPPGKKGAWPDARSNTVGAAIKQAMEGSKCGGDADEFVRRYVSWALLRPGTHKGSSVWVYACLRLNGVAGSNQVTLIAIPASHLARVFPTARKQSSTVSGLFQDSRTRVTQAYSPGPPRKYRWFGDWKGMLSANYTRDVGKKDRCHGDTDRLPVIDSRRLVDMWRPVLKSMPASGAEESAEEIPATAKARPPQRQEAESDSEPKEVPEAEATAPPPRKRAKTSGKSQPQPAPKPPADDPLVKLDGTVAGLPSASIAEYAAVAGMSALSDNDRDVTKWVPVSSLSQDSAPATPPPPPRAAAATTKPLVEQLAPLEANPVPTAAGITKKTTNGITATITKKKHAQKRLREAKQKASNQQRAAATQAQEDPETQPPKAKKQKTSRSKEVSISDVPQEPESTPEPKTPNKRKASPASPPPAKAIGNTETPQWTKRKKARGAAGEAAASPVDPMAKKPTAKVRRALETFHRAALAQKGTPVWFSKGPVASKLQALETEGGHGVDPLVGALYSAAKSMSDEDHQDQGHCALDRLIMAYLKEGHIRAFARYLRDEVARDRFKPAFEALQVLCKEQGWGPAAFQVLVDLALRLHRPQPMEPAGSYLTAGEPEPAAEKTPPLGDSQEDLGDFNLFAGMSGMEEEKGPNGDGAEKTGAEAMNTLKPLPLGAVALQVAQLQCRKKNFVQFLDTCESEPLRWLADCMTQAERNGDEFVKALSLYAQGHPDTAFLPALLAMGWFAMVPHNTV